jgi:Trp operon repressor
MTALILKECTDKMLTKFFKRSHIIPKLIDAGETFTDKEIAEIYGVSLTTIRRWKKAVKARRQPNTKLCSTLPHSWIIKKNGKWERTEWKGVFN